MGEPWIYGNLMVIWWQYIGDEGPIPTYLERFCWGYAYSALGKITTVKIVIES